MCFFRKKIDLHFISTAFIIVSLLYHNLTIFSTIFYEFLEVTSNKIYQGKASMLFVDIRQSSKLPNKYSVEQLVKIYRSYIRTVVQAIRYCGGDVRDFSEKIQAPHIYRIFL